MNPIQHWPWLLIASFLPAGWTNAQEDDLPERLSFARGPINSAVISGPATPISIYRHPEPGAAKVMLLTHARRDLVEAARPGVDEQTRLLAPKASQLHLEQAEKHWEDWWTKRFDYYGQEVTKIPARSLPPSDLVSEGDLLDLDGLQLRVLETPGFTRDGVTYLTDLEGTRVAFTGNLIWEGGRVFDLYSFQNQIQEAKIGAYHGYGGRFAPWIASLEKLAAAKPDLIVPSRGPLIKDPQRDLQTAIQRVRAIYANYISTNALHWYFGEERMKTAFERVLGPDAVMESLPLCEHIDLPPWVRHLGTTKLLVAESGQGFVLDVGGTRSLESLQQLLADGLIKGIDGIWVTHLHNDHSRSVAAAQEAFDCPVYASELVARGLRKPGAYFTPGLSPHTVREVTSLTDGASMQWEEFTFTARYFPGQMWWHGGLLVEKPDHKPVFFIGDSFSPSGIDDYCLMNRNLLREDDGYLLCFRIVREEIPAGSWLVNQHIPHLFRFNNSEWDYLTNRYRQRIEMISEFTPWDDVNYAVDEQWAWAHPYGQESQPGAKAAISVKVMNHSTRKREFTLTLHGSEEMTITPSSLTLSHPPRGEVSYPFQIQLSQDLKPGIQVVTFSLQSGDGEINLPQWSEALIRITEGS